MRKETCRKAVLGLCLSLLMQAGFADELTDRAKAFIEQSKYQAAYDLLRDSEPTRAGEPVFDLLLGVSAVNVGQHTRGVFALERVLAVQPNNVRARAEIARAYLALGETRAARQEFASVQDIGVPWSVSMTIDRMLDAVDRLDAVTRPTLRGFVEGTLGYDSNINVGPRVGTVAVPAFGGLQFNLSDTSRALSSSFGSLGAGFNARVPLDGGAALVGGVSAALRNHFGDATTRQFDNLIGDAYAGVVLTRDKHVFSLNAQYNQYNLNSTFRTATGVSGQWQYNLDANNQLSLFAQYADMRYPAQAVRDANRWVGGVAFAHAFTEGRVTYASLYAVKEKPHDGAYAWGGFNGLGARIGGQMKINERTTLFANALAEYRNYDAEYALFRTTRRDRQYEIAFGASYEPARLWKIMPRFSWMFNDANIELNKYHRELFSLTVRRDF